MGNDGSKGRSSKLASSIGLSSSSSTSMVQRHLEMASKSRVLQLKGLGIKTLPEQIYELAHTLRHIELGDNKLKTLPPFIGDFCCLKQLHLANNQLETLPEEIGQIKTLEVLDVSNNKLTKVPETLGACFPLKMLILANNNLSYFPVVSCCLPNLDTLDLSKNVIDTLPDEIASIHANEINLNQNRLSSINAPALTKCRRLKILRLEENCLNKQEFTKELLEDSNLANITINGNLFQEKEFHDLHGYEKYQERYTATRRKM